MTGDEIYLWVSLGDPSSPPQRVRAEVCMDCAALVPLSTFDTHGRYHAALERATSGTR